MIDAAEIKRVRDTNGRSSIEYINAVRQAISQLLIERAASDAPGMTRGEICEVLGVPRTTAYDSLRILLEEKRVRKYSKPKPTRGRPMVYWRLRK